jgi:hypothetical protein
MDILNIRMVYFENAFRWSFFHHNLKMHGPSCKSCKMAPTCFGSSLLSSGSFLDPSDLPEIQIECVLYHIMCGYVACGSDCDTPAHRPRNHTLCYIPPIRFVFQVTQKDTRSSLMMAGYCRNM